MKRAVIFGLGVIGVALDLGIELSVALARVIWPQPWAAEIAEHELEELRRNVG
jgi:hypothetical protein